MSEEKPSGQSPLAAVLGIAALGGVAWFWFGGGLERQAAKDVRAIEQQVAVDQVQQYEIAKRNGDPTDICMQAGMVAAGFLQAKDEAQYQAWKKTEATDCAEVLPTE